MGLLANIPGHSNLRTVRRSVNNEQERMWKEAVVTFVWGEGADEYRGHLNQVQM
jgi:hypothetical protein